ncbi:MAG: peptidoglycan editing factor PgeF [Lachnospiraceae bacterium]|nr:peptidoglycan editing factor PgeF [Lachnospiraceae bacterium]
MTELSTVRSSLISYPHGFSTRTGGVSTGIFESLNLGMNRGDDPELVKENYRRFLSSCGIEKEEFVCGEQVHGNNVMVVGKEHARPPYGYDELFMADGYVTAEAGVPLVIFIADCIPLLMADEKAGVVASVHCGWRSTVADIEGNAVKLMQSLGATPGNIRACIGPAIGRCCFEVGSEVIEAVNTLLGTEANDLYELKANGKYMLDLKGALARRLTNIGLDEGNVEIVKDCTMCMPERYWSHRYTKGVRGSQAAVIMKLEALG